MNRTFYEKKELFTFIFHFYSLLLLFLSIFKKFIFIILVLSFSWLHMQIKKEIEFLTELRMKE